MPSREAKKGYMSIYHDSVLHSKLKGSDLEAGPCVVNETSTKLACEQLWTHVLKIISQANEMITPFLKLAGVKKEEILPFCHTFHSSLELFTTYISYCPRTFV